MEKEVKIVNETGVHARPAGALVKLAGKFSSDISIEFNGSLSNAKSIMNVLSLGLKKEDEIKIIANGEDEKEAIKALVDLIESKFGEA